MYPKNMRSANARLSDTTTTATTAVHPATTTATEKIEDQEQQPIHCIPPVKEEEKEESPIFKKPQKRVSFDLIPFYINGDSSQMASSSMSATTTTTIRQGKENIAAFHEILGRRKRNSPGPVKGAGISKNTTNTRHHRRHQRRLQHYRRIFNNSIRQNDTNNDTNATSSHQPRLILKGPKEPKYRAVKFKFEGRIIRSVDMEIPAY